MKVERNAREAVAHFLGEFQVANHLQNKGMHSITCSSLIFTRWVYAYGLYARYLACDHTHPTGLRLWFPLSDLQRNETSHLANDEC